MKRSLLTLVLTIIVSASFACDICGCSSGNYFIGLFPEFRKHFIGMRYTFRSFHSIVADDKSQFSNDLYQTTEIWGGINLSSKWQLLGFIPYNINRQASDDGIKKNHGIGDMTFIASYKLFNTASGNGKMISQEFRIGGGVKLPTGKFNADPDDIIADANNQSGSGSIDFLVNAMYTLHISDWGINSNVSYKMNRDAHNFRFGNRFNANAFIFHSFNSTKTTFNPNVGVLYENLQSNKLDNIKVDGTGGNALLAAAGLETVFKKTAIGFNVQLPVSQNLSGGQTTAKIRGMAHVTFVF